MGTFKAFATGNLVEDPEMRYTPAGKAVCDFKVAVNLGYGEYAYTEYLRCVAWEKKAEFVNQYFTKGSGVVLELTPKTESWEDKATGEKKYMVKYTANEVSFPPSSGKDKPAAESPQPRTQPTATARPQPTQTRQPARNVPQPADPDLPF